MEILALIGSPRKQGNTDLMADEMRGLGAIHVRGISSRSYGSPGTYSTFSLDTRESLTL